MVKAGPTFSGSTMKFMIKGDAAPHLVAAGISGDKKTEMMIRRRLSSAASGPSPLVRSINFI